MVLGHRLTGMRTVYDRHDYLDEKRAALELWQNPLRKILKHKDGWLTAPWHAMDRREQAVRCLKAEPMA